MDRLRDDCAAWIWGLKPGSGTNMQWHECRGRGPITKNQVAALLKDFEIRLQGGAIRGRDCAFLATRAEHSNTQAWGRRKDVKVFGCSDDCARCGTAKIDRNAN